jgi:hypothetical protein
MVHQAHAFLVGALEICAVYGVSILVTGTIVVAAGFVIGVWRRQRRSSRLDYERHEAEQTIRSIKRRAIQEMLAAEREHRDLGGSGEIIEGTAVEVMRW